MDKFFEATVQVTPPSPRDDIIRMAREAGLPYMYQTGEVANLGLVERFAALVAAAEREACAKACEEEIKRAKPVYSVVAENALKAIRARGNT